MEKSEKGSEIPKGARKLKLMLPVDDLGLTVMHLMPFVHIARGTLVQL